MKKNLRLFSLLTLALMVFSMIGQVYVEAEKYDEKRKGSLIFRAGDGVEAGRDFKPEDFTISFASEELEKQAIISDNAVVFEDLDHGSYTIKSKYTDQPIELTIPMTNKAGDAWDYDIEINLKGVEAGDGSEDQDGNQDGSEVKEDLDLEKYILDGDEKKKDLGTYELGGELEWLLEANIPKNIGHENSSMLIENQMDERLEYIEGSARLVVGDEEFKLDLDENARLVLSAEAREFLAGREAEKFSLRYRTRVVDYDKKSIYREIESGVVLSYRDGEKGLELEDRVTRSIREEDGQGKFKPIVRTSGIKVDIRDKDNTAIMLEGSEFKILDSAGEEVTAYQYEIDGAEANLKEKKNRFTVGKDGARIFNLQPGSYTIVQTKAIELNGKKYNLSKEVKEIEISASAAGVEYDYNILNTSGFELPNTGGMGTRILSLGGLSLLILALVMKRRNAI